MEKIANVLGGENDKKLKTAATKARLDPMISNLIKKEKISEEDSKKNMSHLMDTIDELKNCKSCPGYEKCRNHIRGYVYYPSMQESHLTFNYIPCKVLKQRNNDLENKNASVELKNARMKDIDIKDKNRLSLIKWLKSFYDNYDVTQNNKGLYLHGSFGSGKTFLLACLLNELVVKKSIKYEIVYFPELLRNLKDNFSSLDSKVQYYSNIEILVLDDIGAEKVTDWGRDEILGTILQFRMNNHKTTFFTSNLNIEELEKHLSLSKESEDALKARRIIERIKQLTEDIELLSVNRRK